MAEESKGNRHWLSPGWIIVILIFIAVLTLSGFFIAKQIIHNGNTIEALQDENAKLQDEIKTRNAADCALFRGRVAFEQLMSSWLALEAQQEAGVGPEHANEALALKAQLDHQIETEKLSGCKIPTVGVGHINLPGGQT